jgi:hypothetical protein
MTARNGSAEWHGNLESGSGTITVPVSRALAGIPEIGLSAKLVSA